MAILSSQLASVSQDLQSIATRVVVPRKEDCQGFSALHVAVLSTRSEATSLLLDSAARTSCKTESTLLRIGYLEALLKARDAHGRTALHVAAAFGCEEVCTVSALIQELLKLRFIAQRNWLSSIQPSFCLKLCGLALLGQE
jgi:ankyrin repeat protein